MLAGERGLFNAFKKPCNKIVFQWIQNYFMGFACDFVELFNYDIVAFVGNGGLKNVSVEYSFYH